MVAERHELVELRERRAWDLLLLARVPADSREHADRLRPREYCAAEAVHGVCEGELPREGSVVRVDHCKISVEAVDGVSDEGARVRAGHFAADGVEYNEAVEETFVRLAEYALYKLSHRIPECARVSTCDQMEHALVWVAAS